MRDLLGAVPTINNPPQLQSFECQYLGEPGVVGRWAKAGTKHSNTDDVCSLLGGMGCEKQWWAAPRGRRGLGARTAAQQTDRPPREQTRDLEFEFRATSA
jgi:hypothetical protein